MRWIALVYGAGWLLAAKPEKPVRWVAPRDGLLHVSLHRGYDQTPGGVTVQGWVEDAPDGKDPRRAVAAGMSWLIRSAAS